MRLAMGDIIEFESNLYVDLRISGAEPLTRVWEMLHTSGSIEGEPFHLKQMSIWDTRIPTLILRLEKLWLIEDSWDPLELWKRVTVLMYRVIIL